MPALVLLTAATLSLSAGCARERYQEVRLAHRVPTSAAARPGISRPVLRVALAGVISPRSAITDYDDLIRYLETRLHLSATVVAGRTYAETNRLLRVGDADMAFVCTYAYVKGRHEFGLQLLAAPQVAGRACYQSYIIVPRGSKATRLTDLRGARFAFTDPLSFTGRIYVLSALSRQGVDAKTFFSKVIYTSSHDNSVHMVAKGLVDGAAVDSLVYDNLAARHDRIAAGTRIIERSPLFCSPPVVASPHLSDERARSLQEALLTMHEDEPGRLALQRIGVERFVAVDDADYDSVRAIAREVEEE
ncbi:MAG: PhnD/SsuA/transferrin family substrate-binding protein, partial [Armatimonadota bacterium]